MRAGPEDGSCRAEGASMAGPMASLSFRRPLGAMGAV